MTSTPRLKYNPRHKIGVAPTAVAPNGNNGFRSSFCKKLLDARESLEKKTAPNPDAATNCYQTTPQRRPLQGLAVRMTRKRSLVQLQYLPPLENKRLPLEYKRHGEASRFGLLEYVERYLFQIIPQNEEIATNCYQTADANQDRWPQ